MKKPEQQNNTFCFPTPQNPGKSDDHTTKQTQILEELIQLNEQEKLNPQESTEYWNNLLKRFHWTDTLLTKSEEQAIEIVLVDYHYIFARHRMDIGMNTELKLRLTRRDDKSVYSEHLSTSIHLKGDLFVELVPMHKYGIITVLPFSNYTSLIFAKRKSNGKIRLLVDLRKINSLSAEYYTYNNHPVSTLPDTAQHLAGKSLFYKLNCSQAYHCLQMAAQRSGEVLAFKFSSKLSPTKDVRKALSNLCLPFQVSSASLWIKVVKADQCAQNLDDIRIAAKNAMDFTRNIRAVFKCIRQAGLKWTSKKCRFRVRQVQFLRRTI